MIDYTINIVGLIQIAVLVVGGFITVGGGLIAAGSFKSTVRTMKNDMTDMKEEIKKVGQVLTTMAVMTKRQDYLEQDVRDLKHGRGFIQNRSDSGINGEYP